MYAALPDDSGAWLMFTGTTCTVAGGRTMSITLAAVFAPIGFQSGLTGALFREFAFTLAASVIISGFVALTLTPMMSSKVLRHNPSLRGFEHLLDVAFTKLQTAYERTLHAVLETRPEVVIVAVLVFASIPAFFLMSKSELAPAEDDGIIFMQAQAAPNARSGTASRTRRFRDADLPALRQSLSHVPATRR